MGTLCIFLLFAFSSQVSHVLYLLYLEIIQATQKSVPLSMHVFLVLIWKWTVTNKRDLRILHLHIPVLESVFVRLRCCPVGPDFWRTWKIRARCMRASRQYLRGTQAETCCLPAPGPLPSFFRHFTCRISDSLKTINTINWYHDQSLAV